MDQQLRQLVVHRVEDGNNMLPFLFPDQLFDLSQGLFQTSLGSIFFQRDQAVGSQKFILKQTFVLLFFTRQIVCLFIELFQFNNIKVSAW